MVLLSGRLDGCIKRGGWVSGSYVWQQTSPDVHSVFSCGAAACRTHHTGCKTVRQPGSQERPNQSRRFWARSVQPPVIRIPRGNCLIRLTSGVRHKPWGVRDDIGAGGPVALMGDDKAIFSTFLPPSRVKKTRGRREVLCQSGRGYSTFTRFSWKINMTQRNIALHNETGKIQHCLWTMSNNNAK